jgi:hypothetical protein
MTRARPGSAKCVEGGVVGVGQGVQVFLGGTEAAVAEALFDDLDVGAPGEEPGGVGVAQVVGSDGDADARLLQALRAPADDSSRSSWTRGRLCSPISGSVMSKPI